MSIYESFNENQTKTLLALLIHASKIDHTNHFNEIQFIKAIAKELKVTDEVLVDLRNKSEDFVFELPEDENERTLMFVHVIHLIRIDGKISHSEVNLAHQIGLLLGLNPLLIKDLIDSYQHEINTGDKLTDNELSKLIKKYLN